ncbi:MAG: thioredoxin family protein, partial [Gammaproteobacteria bacterium]
MFRFAQSGRYFLLLLVLLVSPVANALISDQPVWYGKDANGQTVIHLYFFWSKKCPHCLKARPDIIKLEQDYPWLKLHSLELVDHPENIQTYISMAETFGSDARSVPTFMFCGNLLSGYESEESTGRLL